MALPYAEWADRSRTGPTWKLRWCPTNGRLLGLAHIEAEVAAAPLPPLELIDERSRIFTRPADEIHRT